MSINDAALLLGMRLPDASLRTCDQEELVKELDLLPLAISQASAYMAHRRVNTTQYLQLLGQEQQSFLSGASSNLQHVDISPAKSQTNAVFKTLQVTVARLAKESVQAEMLLTIMATCNGQFFPQYFLDDICSVTKQDVVEFVSILCNLSLVRVHVNGAGFSIHKLVRGAIHDWILQNAHQDVVNVASGIVLQSWLECNRKGDWLRQCEISNHANDILFGFGRSVLDPVGRLKLLNLAGQHLLAIGCFAESCKVYRDARNCLPSLPPEHRQDMAGLTLQGLALALLNNDGRDEDGLALLRSSIEADGKLGLPAAYKYLLSVSQLADQTASNSLSENREVEVLLLRVEDWCGPTAEKDEYQRGALAGMNALLSTLYLIRYRNWGCWRANAGADLKVYAEKEWLRRARYRALEADAEVRTLTTATLHTGLEVTRVVLALTQVLTAEGRYEEAGFALRHALCFALKCPMTTVSGWGAETLTHRIDAIQQALQQPEITREAFAEQHEHCSTGIHGCRIFDAELD